MLLTYCSELITVNKCVVECTSVNSSFVPFHHHVEFDLIVFNCVSATDVKFSQTAFGRPVPFASAGDCYSAAKCPQVPSLYVLDD